MADANGGERLHNQLRPPLHNRPRLETSILGRHRIGPLRFPSKASTGAQGTHRLQPVQQNSVTIVV